MVLRIREGCGEDQRQGLRRRAQGPGDDLRPALQYRESLGNPPHLVVADTQRHEVHTNFTGTVEGVREEAAGKFAWLTDACGREASSHTRWRTSSTSSTSVSSPRTSATCEEGVTAAAKRLDEPQLAEPREGGRGGVEETNAHAPVQGPSDLASERRARRGGRRGLRLASRPPGRGWS